MYFNHDRVWWLISDRDTWNGTYVRVIIRYTFVLLVWHDRRYKLSVFIPLMPIDVKVKWYIKTTVDTHSTFALSRRKHTPFYLPIMILQIRCLILFLTARLVLGFKSFLPSPPKTKVGYYYSTCNINKSIDLSTSISCAASINSNISGKFAQDFLRLFFLRKSSFVRV